MVLTVTYVCGGHRNSGSGSGRGRLNRGREAQDCIQGAAAQHFTVSRQIVARHPFHREALLEPATNRIPIQRLCERNCGDCFIEIIDDEASDAVVDDFRHRATAKSNYRRTIGHRFDDSQAERLGPIDRKQQCQRITQERSLSSSRISPRNSISGSLSSGLILVL